MTQRVSGPENYRRFPKLRTRDINPGFNNQPQGAVIMKPGNNATRKILGITLTALLGMTLAACGGGGGGGGGGDPGPSATPKNVALATNGGVASDNYSNSSAGYVNDGDTTTTQYWAATDFGDTITVVFDKPYTVSTIKYYTNATNSVDTQIQISTDGVNFRDVEFFTTAYDPYCANLTMGSGQITCGLAASQQAKAVRLFITATTDFSNKRIYELEVTGQ
jgi:hypothetical protein